MRGRPRVDIPATLSPTTLDIAFTAGFYEGEGHFKVSNDNAEVIIGQNDPEKLNWLCARYGGKVLGPYAGSIGNETYQWRLTRERAIGFMLTIFTFLSKSRRIQFTNAVNGLGSKRDHKQYKSKNLDKFFANEIREAKYDDY